MRQGVLIMKYFNSFFKMTAFLFCCVSAVSACTKTEDEKTDGEKISQTKIEYEMISENFDGGEVSEKSTVTYPVFNAYPELNEIVKTKVGNLKNDFITQLKKISQIYKAGEEMPEVEFVLSAGDIISMDGYIGFILKAYMFTGGPHGITKLEAVNFNTNTMKEISLEDVLKPMSEDWLEKLSLKAVEELSKVLKSNGKNFYNEEAVKEGAGAEASNFKNFNILDESIFIVFEQYQVASYAAGMPEITIPLSVFK